MSYENNLPMISIVIVNSDGTEDTLNCLDSIFRNPPSVPFEVILVDNFSEVPCLEPAAERYPDIIARSAPQQQGFSKNYNLGMRQSRGELVLIINNDTVVHPQALDILINEIRRHEEYGMVGPKLLNSQGKIQSVCARELLTPWRYILTQFLLDLGLPSGKLWESYRQWKLEKKGSGPVACISGACMLLKREVLDQVGLLDEVYKFYYEDVEWCHRVQKYGYQVAYIAEAEITHLGDRSLSQVKEWAKRSEYESAMRYFRQYHQLSRAKIRILWMSTVLSYFLRACAYWAMEKIAGRPLHARDYFHLTRWVAQQSPG